MAIGYYALTSYDTKLFVLVDGPAGDAAEGALPAVAGRCDACLLPERCPSPLPLASSTGTLRILKPKIRGT